LENLQEITSSTLRIIPELFLMLGLLFVLVSMFFVSDQRFSNFLFGSSLFILILFFCLCTIFYGHILKDNTELRFFDGLLILDRQAVFFKQLIAIAGIVMLLHVRVFKYHFDQEIYFLFLCIIFGLSIASMTTHFVVLFLSLEMVSLATYGLVMNGRKKANYEAAMKYFIFGCTTSGIMLYGVSLFYGLSHSLDFSTYSPEVFTDQNPIAIQVLGSLVVGIMLFKTAAFPFHSWLPDVYEVTETPVVSFLSIAPKAVGFLVLGRFLHYNFFDATALLIFVSVGCLLVGNLAALWQDHSKRLLGFSGIAQTGFILIGFLSFKNGEYYGAYYYIAAYLVISMAGFWLIDYLFSELKSYDVKTYLGWGQKNIIIAINAIIIMIALVGLPPTVGFSAKLVVFGELLSKDIGLSKTAVFVLITFGMLNMAVSIYYYLRIPFYLLLKNPKGAVKTQAIDMRAVFLTYLSICILFLFFNADLLGSLIDSLQK
jgi:NADH-quinone oxidoreductase subunit N